MTNSKNIIRNQETIDFLNDFKVASTSTIATLFYPSLRIAQRQLSRMVDEREIKRDRPSVSNEYIYFLRRPSQLKHRLYLTEFYKQLVITGAKVTRFQNEFTTFDGLRPDAFIVYNWKGRNYIAFVEVEISNNRLNISKYKDLLESGEYKKIFPLFPNIIAITNKQIEDVDGLTITKINLDFSNMSDLLPK